MARSRKPLTDAEIRARHAARVLELAAGVVAAVHDEGAEEVLAAVRRALAVRPPDGVDPVAALVTVLAAAIDPARSLNELLGWTRPLRPVPNAAVPGDPSMDCDVELLLNGRAAADQVTRAARKEAVRQLTAQRLTANEIAIRIGLDPRSVTRLRDAGEVHRDAA